MTQVLIIYETVEPCNIEAVRLFSHLASRGVIKFTHKLAKQVNNRDINECDVLLSVRSTSLLELDLGKKAQSLGKLWVLLLDDDFLNLGKDYGADGSGYWNGRKKTLVNIVKRIDCLIAVNELLAKKYTEIGGIPRYVLLDTVVQKEELYNPKKKEETAPVNIVLYTNDGTTGMFDEIIRPIIPRLATEYPNRITLHFIALHPDLKDVGTGININYVPHMSYADFKRFMGESGFDIGLSPLLDEGFSQFKYFNKYIEYSVAGIPAIYSDCRLYRLCIKDGENGTLCANTAEGWYNAVANLINNPELRVKMAVAAQNDLVENHSVDKVLNRLCEGIPEIVNGVPPTSKQCSPVFFLYVHVRYALFRICGWTNTMWNFIRKGAFGPMLNRFIKRFVKK